MRVIESKGHRVKRSMNIAGIKKMFDPIYIRGVLILIPVILFIAVTYHVVGKAEKRVRAKKAEILAFNGMQEEYLKERRAIEPFIRKILLPPSDKSLGSIIEEMAKGIGIKGNIVSIKPMEEGTEKGYIKTGIDVKIEGITLNQMVNLLYRIENFRNLILIKGFVMKSRFENPDLLDITMHVVLFTKGHE